MNKKGSFTVKTPFGPMTFEGDIVEKPKTYAQGLADGIAQGRRDAAEAYCDMRCSCFDSADEKRKCRNKGPCNYYNHILGDTTSKGEA